MRHDLLVSDCETYYLINAKLKGSDYVRAGILLCVNSTNPIATFTLADQKFRLLIPEECLDSSQITKTLNLDLHVLKRDEQVRIPDPR